MIVAAGVLLRSPKGTYLLLKRTGASDYQDVWGLPGGKVEGEETLADAAIRETKEEIDYNLDVAGQVHTRRISGDTDFTTFIKDVSEEFVPTLNEEHSAFAWVTPEDAMQMPLHPGCYVVFQRLSCDELGIATLMSTGELASPERYENVMLVDMRITGTGVSYRRALDEFVYRRPENYLTPEFLQRCNGLPVIMMHPEKFIMNSKEFSDRVVGTMMLPYLKGEEVWGIAKIYDDETKNLIEDHQLSTSPAVVFRDQTVNSKMTLEDGSTLLIEGKPSLLDHLAICQNGVWDKGEEPNGIRVDSNGETTMTEEEVKAKADAEAEKAKADAEMAKADSEKLDKVLASMDSMRAACDGLSKRLDAIERKDSEKEEKREDRRDNEEERKADKTRRDAEEEERKKEEEEKERKDAEEKEREERKADSAEIRKMIADMSSKLPKARSDEDYASMADAQARADSVYNAFGKHAPRPLDGESLSDYRRRLCTDLKTHSKTWKGINMSAITDDEAFSPVETQIYADAMEAAHRPVDLAAGELREVTTTDRLTGQRMTKFLGANTFISSMKRPVRRATVVASRH